MESRGRGEEAMTWHDLAVAAGWPREMADYALWNMSAYPFTGPREIWYQLRHSWRLSRLSIPHLPEAMDGGFR